MQVIKGSVGQLDFKEKISDKPALMILSVVEEKFAPPTVDETGKNVWGTAEKVWHNDIIISGEHAYTFRDTFVKGDPVILLGKFGKEKIVTADGGRTFTNKSFFVDSFGPDATRSQVAVIRSPRAGKPISKVVEPEKTQHFADTYEAKATELVLSKRCNEMIDKGFLEPVKLQHLGHAWGSARSVTDAEKLVAKELENDHPAVREYLVSVVAAHAGTGVQKNWAELVPPEPPTTHKQTETFKQSMQNVAKIRSEIRQG